MINEDKIDTQEQFTESIEDVQKTGFVDDGCCPICHKPFDDCTYFQRLENEEN